MSDHETTEPILPRVDPPKVPGVVVLFENGRTTNRVLRAADGPIRIESGDAWVELVPDEKHERSGIIVAAGGDIHALGYDCLDDAPGLCTVVRVGETIAVLHRDVVCLRRVSTLPNVDYPLHSQAHFTLQRERGDRALLLTGEAGTDKVRIARAIHRGGERADKPFVHLTPEALRLREEASLHERDAAILRYFDALLTADGGTIVLEHFDRFRGWLYALGDYLRVPREERRMCVGGFQLEEPLDIQVIVVADREGELDLLHEISNHEFPGAVWDHSEQLHIPAMTEHWPSVPTYIEWAVRNAGSRVRISARFVEACIERPWPGNQQELFAAVSTAIENAEARGRDVLRAEDMPEPAETVLPGFVESGT